jgi:hypothetical protein
VNLRKWAGVFLIGLSGVWFALLLSTPFLPLALEMKAAAGIAFLVLMEVSFWLGTVIIGKQVVSAFWARFKKRRTNGKSP